MCNCEMSEQFRHLCIFVFKSSRWLSTYCNAVSWTKDCIFYSQVNKLFLIDKQMNWQKINKTYLDSHLHPVQDKIKKIVMKRTLPVYLKTTAWLWFTFGCIVFLGTAGCTYSTCLIQIHRLLVYVHCVLFL